MAEITEAQDISLQEKIDALNEQIGHLEQVIAKNAESVKSIGEQIAHNKDDEKAIFRKYEDTIQKVFGENYKKSANAERIGDLTDIAKSIRQDIKANASKKSTAELQKKLDEILQDIEKVRQLRSENRQLNSDKKSASQSVDSSNDELTRFREALRSISMTNNSHLENIDKTNTSIDKSNASIDHKIDGLTDIFMKLDDIYNAMPDNTEEEIIDGPHKKDETDTRRDDDDYKEREESLKNEAESAVDLKNNFKELLDVINSKNEALTDENNLINAENEKLGDAVSVFKEMHKEADDTNTALKDGQKNLANPPKSSGSGGKFWGFLTDALDTAYDLTLGINDKWNEIDDKAHDFGHTIGMSGQQMESYRRLLMSSDMTGLMGKYHIMLDDIIKMQTGYADMANNAKILTTNEISALEATAKYVNPETSLAVAANLRELGGSIIDSQGYLAMAMERAKGSGLNMAKYSKNFADNIKLASKYNFKNGLSDIAKMTALTDRWQVNLGAFAQGLATSFESIESSIDTSAKLQVLGGPMAAQFGNPLEMMNMIYTDMDGVIERFKDSIKDAGKFNEETGIVEISAFQKKILEYQAKALNLNYDDVTKAVNSEEKARAIDKQVHISGLDDMQKEWLHNMAEYDSIKHKWYVSTLDEFGNMVQKPLEDIDSEAELKTLISSANTEEEMRGDVHAIREHLLKGVEDNSAQNAVTSYLKHRDSAKDKVMTELAGVLEPAEQLKLDAIYCIEDKIDVIIGYFKKIPQMWNNGIDKVSGWLGHIPLIGGTLQGWLEKLKFGNTKGGKAAAALSIVGSFAVAVVAVKKLAGLILTKGPGLILKGLKAGAKGIWKGGKWAFNKIRGGGATPAASTAEEAAATASKAATEEATKGASEAATKVATEAASKTATETAAKEATTTASRAMTDAELKLSEKIAAKEAKLTQMRLKNPEGSKQIDKLVRELKGLKDEFRHTSKIANQALERNAATVAEKGAAETIEKGATQATEKAVTQAAEKAATQTTEKIAVQATEKAVTQATEKAAASAAEQIIEKGGATAAEKVSAEVASKMGAEAGTKLLTGVSSKALGSAIGGGAAAALIEVPMAMYETSERNKQYINEVEQINTKYSGTGKNNLYDQLDDAGKGLYAQADKALEVADASRRRDNDNDETWDVAGGAIAGAAIGTAIGSAIPGLGNVAGFIVGGLIGTVGSIIGSTVGGFIARAEATNVSDEEVYGKEELAQRAFETTKLGFKDVKTKDDLFERAAVATISIHDLLVSQDNEGHGKKWNGDTEEEFEAKKEKLEEQKEARYKEEHPAVWYKPWTWFAEGGIVHAAQGLQSVPSDSQIPSALARGKDTVPAMLSPGEMVLNTEQQGRLFKSVNTPYSSPTQILSSQQGSGGSNRLSFGDLNININGTLKLDTGYGSSANVSGSDLLGNSGFIRELTSQIQRYMDGMFNGGTFAGEHSKYKLEKV